MKFCTHCGTQLTDDAVFCSQCGVQTKDVVGQSESIVKQPVQVEIDNMLNSVAGSIIGRKYTDENIIKKISTDVKTEAILWVITALFQFLFMIIGIIHFTSSWTMILGMCIDIIRIIINLIIGIRYFNYSTNVLLRPIGIVDRYKNINKAYGIIIYGLLFAGLIGVIAGVHVFILRSFVMDNAEQFKEIERKFVMANTGNPMVRN